MNHMNLYKAYLVKNLMRNQRLTAKIAMEQINHFVTTKEGILGFQSWKSSNFKLESENKPQSIKKFIKKDKEIT